jgi:hypothetical protein
MGRALRTHPEVRALSYDRGKTDLGGGIVQGGEIGILLRNIKESMLWI